MFWKKGSPDNRPSIGRSKDLRRKKSLPPAIAAQGSSLDGPGRETAKSSSAEAPVAAIEGWLTTLEPVEEPVNRIATLAPEGRAEEVRRPGQEAGSGSTSGVHPAFRGT
eukprot:3780606-Heterocapsa_arctica.AAC.1